MGNTHMHPATTYNAEGVPKIMNQPSFMIQRTTGEWEEHRLTPPEWDVKYKCKKVISASKTIHGDRGPTTGKWRIFMCNSSVGGWRSLDKIRPVGMTEEEAQVWRKVVEEDLEKIAELNDTVEE
jgi:hypothetical protein